MSWKIELYQRNRKCTAKNVFTILFRMKMQRKEKKWHIEHSNEPYFVTIEWHFLYACACDWVFLWALHWGFRYNAIVVDFDSRRVCSTRALLSFFFNFSRQMYFLSFSPENVDFYSILCREQKCRQNASDMHKIDVYVETFEPSVFCRCRCRLRENSRNGFVSPMKHCYLHTFSLSLSIFYLFASGIHSILFW